MGLGRSMLDFPSSLGFGVGGQSYSDFLASTVRGNISRRSAGGFLTRDLIAVKELNLNFQNVDI